MSRLTPLPFQEAHSEALLARFRALQAQYQRLGAGPAPEIIAELRTQAACVLLQAPTGIGKTLIACETMSRFSEHEQILWFWFAPFAGVIEQARTAMRCQAPRLPQLDIQSGRRPEQIESGAVFVLTWQTVAARSRDSRLARQTGDLGIAIDELVLIAREQGLRIGVVVDEAHHGFVKAPAACEFFRNVLAPDYVLLMTATPRDDDAGRFSSLTGYRLGGPEEWASIPRSEGVEAQLLKRSVKAARFVARSQDEGQLVSFEEVALSECTSMHRLLKKRLDDAGVPLSPLMLVQVPNGADAIKRAKAYLVDVLKFEPESVRVHTADEPDPSLSAMADDPAVEVILFKMAIATGFDAPRAFTLAALRGTRDRNFGIQVVGRIMRVHRLLQGRLVQLPPELAYGYVFLANGEAQEGLLGAAAEINQMPEHLAAANTSAVVTVFADRLTVQCVGEGETLSLAIGDPLKPVGSPISAGAEPSQENAERHSVQFCRDLFSAQGPEGQAIVTHGQGEPSRLTTTLALDAQRGPRGHERRADAPTSLVTEVLPEITDDLEEQLATHIEFSPKVLDDRLRVRSRLVERTTDVFAADAPADRDIWAKMSSALIAEHAQQIAFEFDDVDRRSFHRLLKERFRRALEDTGHELPETEEELSQQLDILLVRNPNLIRNAYKRIRLDRVMAQDVPLPATLTSEIMLDPAAKNIYGVFPEDLSDLERDLAEALDTSEGVLWWHRNPPRKPYSVGLYRWNAGIGFFPDFVVGVVGRTEGDGVALSEVKGRQLLQYDRLKAGATHMKYGRVFMVGRETNAEPFRLWRLVGDALVDDGIFEVQRLRYS